MATYYKLPEFSGILSFIDSIFAELNMGLFIYHLEDLDDPAKLRLIYVSHKLRQRPVVPWQLLRNRK